MRRISTIALAVHDRKTHLILYRMSSSDPHSHFLIAFYYQNTIKPNNKHSRKNREAEAKARAKIEAKEKENLN